MKVCKVFCVNLLCSFFLLQGSMELQLPGDTAFNDGCGGKFKIVVEDEEQPSFDSTPRNESGAVRTPPSTSPRYEFEKVAWNDMEVLDMSSDDAKGSCKDLKIVTSYSQDDLVNYGIASSPVIFSHPDVNSESLKLHMCKHLDSFEEREFVSNSIMNETRDFFDKVECLQKRLLNDDTITDTDYIRSEYNRFVNVYKDIEPKLSDLAKRYGKSQLEGLKKQLENF